MNEEQDLKLTDLDYLTVNHHLQMMKAALPYMEVPEQRMLSVFVKINELQRTISLFRNEEVASMGICSLEGRSRKSPLEMLKAIKPYATSAEQELIDLASTLLQGGRTSMANLFQGFSGFGGEDGLLSAAQLFGRQGHPQPGMDGEIPDSEIPASEIPISEIPDSKTPDPEIPVSDSQAGGNDSSSSQRAFLDQLKGFLSPEQQSRLEMVQMMMQAMHQLT